MRNIVRDFLSTRLPLETYSLLTLQGLIQREKVHISCEKGAQNITLVSDNKISEVWTFLFQNLAK